jgi:hypothetical protein
MEECITCFIYAEWKLIEPNIEITKLLNLTYSQWKKEYSNFPEKKEVYRALKLLRRT